MKASYFAVSLWLARPTSLCILWRAHSDCGPEPDQGVPGRQEMPWDLFGYLIKEIKEMQALPYIVGAYSDLHK